MRMSCPSACDGVATASGAVVGSAAPGGAAQSTRMVPLCGLSAAAVWEQLFWFALPRPADVGAKVEFELMASRDKQWVVWPRQFSPYCALRAVGVSATSCQSLPTSCTAFAASRDVPSLCQPPKREPNLTQPNPTKTGPQAARPPSRPH